MAVTSFDPRNPRILPNSGAVPEIVYGLYEGNSQSFKAGQFVYLSSGAVTAVPTGNYSVFGIAQKDATNVSSGNIEIPVQRIRPDDVVLIQVCNNSGTLEAANTTCVPGKSYDLKLVSTNLDYVNSADVTNPSVIFISEVLDGAGAATYWGRFTFLHAENQSVQEPS